MTQHDYDFLLKLAKAGRSMEVSTLDPRKYNAVVQGGYVFAVFRRSNVQFRLTVQGWSKIDNSDWVRKR